MDLEEYHYAELLYDAINNAARADDDGIVDVIKTRDNEITLVLADGSRRVLTVALSPPTSSVNDPSSPRLGVVTNQRLAELQGAGHEIVSALEFGHPSDPFIVIVYRTSDPRTRDG